MIFDEHRLQNKTKRKQKPHSQNSSKIENINAKLIPPNKHIHDLLGTGTSVNEDTFFYRYAKDKKCNNNDNIKVVPGTGLQLSTPNKTASGAMCSRIVSIHPSSMVPFFLILIHVMKDKRVAIFDSYTYLNSISTRYQCLGL